MLKIERHQNVEILSKATWFVDDDFSDGTEEHIFLLWLRILDHLKYLFQKEFGVTNRKATQ
jgi:hypothetical protein